MPKPKNAKPPVNDVIRPVTVVNNITQNLFGDLERIQSQTKTHRKWVPMEKLGQHVGEDIWIRSRVHRTRKKSNKMMFTILREGLHSVQAILLEDAENGITREMVKYCAKVPVESVVDVFCTVKQSDIEIIAASFHKVELVVKKMFVVSAAETLPFQLDDASKKFSNRETTSKSIVTVNRSHRLDHRFIDLRSDVNSAIFRVKSAVCHYFRDYLRSQGFIEIHTPKIVPGVSEGGAEVFKLNYFDQKACLAQSPQLYKQMMISSDFNRVFEVGPVFRAENANTNRHMTEFTGMDIEMAIDEHYDEILDVAGELFVHIFDRLNEDCKGELAIIGENTNAEPLKYLKETKILTFSEAIAMIDGEKTRLRENGMNDEEIEKRGASADLRKDFSTPNEKLLGRLVKEEFGTEFYIVKRYPKEARPFYTMPAPDDPNFTNSYDLFLRGEEITSGAQRVHDVALLKKQAVENDIPLENIKGYLDSFRYGIRPHGGIGVGLERVVMLFLGLENIRECSLFPRDPKRLSP